MLNNELFPCFKSICVTPNNVFEVEKENRLPPCDYRIHARGSNELEKGMFLYQLNSFRIVRGQF